MKLEGIVSKRCDAPYRSGRTRRARPAGRSHLLCGLRSPAQRSLHRSLSPADLQVRTAERAVGQRRCLSVAGKRIDETIAIEMLRAVAPMAIEAGEEGANAGVTRLFMEVIGTS
jgi:hypothetical protein